MVIVLSGTSKRVCLSTIHVLFSSSHTVSPVFITTLYLHVQVPLSLLLALWFLWKDLQDFL